MVWVLILNLQRVGLLRGRKNVVYWCLPLFILFTFSHVFFLIFLSFLLFFRVFSFFLFLVFLIFIVHGYPFLYCLPLWDLPLLSFNCFWLLMGILHGLLISLPAIQPLPLPKVCWLHHSPFSDKITCSFLISFCSCFTNLDKD